MYIYVTEYTISPPTITFKISNTVHFNTPFQIGVIRGLLLAFQYMGQKNNKKDAVVVNIASISGLDPFEFIPIYVGIKHGVLGLTKPFGVGRLCFVVI
jgi:NAD(P)-dependent dehydrogenase (short-subunit alcohol dehydrogenase family)